MSFTQKVTEKFSNFIIESTTTPLNSPKADTLLIVKKEAIREICEFLKDDPAYVMNVLMDLSCIDYLFWEGKEHRFEVLYNLFSLKHNQRIFIKCPVSDNSPIIDSVQDIWPAANWYEREVWDMFGIKFNGHPNLKRILMYEEFKGHALRKDYHYNKRQPLIGPQN